MVTSCRIGHKIRKIKLIFAHFPVARGLALHLLAVPCTDRPPIAAHAAQEPLPYSSPARRVLAELARAPVCGHKTKDSAWQGTAITRFLPL